MRILHFISVAWVASWLVAGCGGIDERTCPNGNCATSCSDNTFVSGGACVALTACEPGSYIAQPGSPTADQVCAPCPSGTFSNSANGEFCMTWRSCPAGSYVTNVPSASSDRLCAPCNAGTYTDGPNQSVCLGAAECTAGTVEASPGTATSRHVCTACAPGQYCAGGKEAAVKCPDDKWDDDGNPATICVAKTVCTAGTSVTQQGSPTLDRACAPCASGSYAPTANLDRCRPWTTCPAGTYVSNTPGPTTDRACSTCPDNTYTTGENQAVCRSAADCPAGTALDSTGTSTSAPVCTPCDRGQYCAGGDSPARDCRDQTWDHDNDPATPCTPWSFCLAGGYVAGPGSATADQVCLPCPEGTFSDVTNSPECTAWKNCAAGTYVSVPATAHSDRSCNECSPARFTASNNLASCTEWKTCPDNTTYVSQPGTSSSDVQCSPCSANGCDRFCTNAGACLACISYTDCAPGLSCDAGECKDLGCGEPAFFSDSFVSGNLNDWTLDGAWEIGPAVAWSGPASGGGTFEDPADDQNGDGDKMLAGVVIGGPVPANVMEAPAYLTSSAVDISRGPSPVYLEYYRWLSTDIEPLMSATVEVFDGDQWVRVWSGPGTHEAPLSDHSWQYQAIDVTPYRNDNFMVRFGYQVRSSSAARVGSWSIDGVRIANTPVCPLMTD